MPPEFRGGTEGGFGVRPLRKIGLETPLSGRYVRENKKLIFAPPPWYQLLVLGCLIAGGVLFLAGFVGWRWVPLSMLGLWLGPSVFLAGVWAALSMEYVVFDLVAKTYLRREGRGFTKRTRRGSLLDLDAVVVYCENYPLGVVNRVVVYRTVIHWKNAVVPLLVTEREQTTLPMSAPLNQASGAIVARAMRYAQSLGTRFHDNSYFHSPPPQAAI